MTVTPLIGLFRAKGDEWGTVTGSSYKPEKPNLLTRTERMARAVQVFLQRQGLAEITSVEAILLCSNPAITVDSLRPIIRVIMRDALERFTVSIAQARVQLTPETVRNIIECIVNPVISTPPQPAEPPPGEGAVAAETQEQEPYVPAFALPGSESTPTDMLIQPDQSAAPETTAAANPPARSRKGVTKKQWIFLIILFVIWCLIIAVLAYLVTKDLFL